MLSSSIVKQKKAMWKKNNEININIARKCLGVLVSLLGAYQAKWQIIITIIDGIPFVSVSAKIETNRNGRSYTKIIELWLKVRERLTKTEKSRKVSINFHDVIPIMIRFILLSSSSSFWHLNLIRLIGPRVNISARYVRILCCGYAVVNRIHASIY